MIYFFCTQGIFSEFLNEVEEDIVLSIVDC